MAEFVVCGVWLVAGVLVARTYRATNRRLDAVQRLVASDEFRALPGPGESGRASNPEPDPAPNAPSRPAVSK
jgi:hypothetical protein